MINIAGIISIVLFYILILGVGLWAARKKQAGDDSEEEVMLAGRSIGLFVGIFTMTGKCKTYLSLATRRIRPDRLRVLSKAFCLTLQYTQNKNYAME
jgi:hypothetical protein